MTWNGTAWAAAAASGGLQFLGATSGNFAVTGIPSTARVLFVAYENVQMNGNYSPLVRLGTSTVEYDFAYVGSCCAIGDNSTAADPLSNGFKLNCNDASSSVVNHGQMTLVKMGPSSNVTWTATCVTGQSNSGRMAMMGGSINTGTNIDRIAFRVSATGGSYFSGTFSVYYM